MWLIRHLAQFFENLNYQMYFDKSFKNEIDKIMLLDNIYTQNQYV